MIWVLEHKDNKRDWHPAANLNGKCIASTDEEDIRRLLNEHRGYVKADTPAGRLMRRGGDRYRYRKYTDAEGNYSREE